MGNHSLLDLYLLETMNIEFPFSFRICAYELTNKYERFNKMGYKSASNYFRGRSMFNESLVGWGGHTENGSNIGTIEGKFIKRQTKFIHKLPFRNNGKCII